VNSKLLAENTNINASPNRAWVRALEKTSRISAHPDRIFPRVVDELAIRIGDASALLSDRQTLTYRALAERANAYSHWALSRGLSKGDVTCLLMTNCPEYMAVWLGITKTGGVVSLLNTSLRGAALAQSIEVARPKYLIVHPHLAEAVKSALPFLTAAPQVRMYGGEGCDFPDINDEVPARTDPAPQDWKVTLDDPALYIYTSGTTGAPKAAKVSHFRLMQWSHWFAGMIDVRPEDRMYNCLPMYHSVGGVVATGAILAAGGSVVLKEKFSASEFWKDVGRWDCTLFQYIGELCRYLLHVPETPNETEHRIRVCCGNGMRSEVWTEFQRRFRIPKILEFYAATEGVFSLFNAEGKPGSIGRIPPLLGHRFPIELVRFDTEKESPFRNDAGFCIRCSANETGEALGKVASDHSGISGRFEGYTDAPASEQKIMRNVFQEGDAWFRTGDLMRKDEKGYFYFVDRVGDTFRWKGENVATSQVSDVVCAFPGITGAVVYGVALPVSDGKAGMAAATYDHELDLAALRSHLNNGLPPFARPVFLRVRAELEATATFKYTKSNLVRDGFDPSKTTDAIFFNDPARGAFIRVDQALFDRIQAGEVRF
jgi:fatty-acyl-CoA synthase